MTDSPDTPKPAAPLRLRAEDAEDLAILAAALQDAIVPVREIAYFLEDRVFALVANRFMWEVGERRDLTLPAGGDPDGFGSDEDDARIEEMRQTGGPLFLRTLSGLAIAHVAKVQSRGVDLKERGRFLNLLTLFVDGDELRLEFSDDVSIRLQVDGMDVRLRDLGEPWPTASCPDHPLEEEDTPPTA